MVKLGDVGATKPGHGMRSTAVCMGKATCSLAMAASRPQKPALEWQLTLDYCFHGINTDDDQRMAVVRTGGRRQGSAVDTDLLTTRVYASSDAAARPNSSIAMATPDSSEAQDCPSTDMGSPLALQVEEPHNVTEACWPGAALRVWPHAA